MTDLTKREIAEREVARLELDRLVRAAARSGQFDGTANYYRHINQPDGQIEIYATAGAGTNSASVRLRGEVVYENCDYGRYLRAYRQGLWVEQIQRLAREQLDREAADKLLRSVSKQKQEDDAFTPLDQHG